MATQFEEWRSELLHVGNIVQDADHSIGWDEREDRFNRYIEMLDALTGEEGFEHVLAVFESLQAEDDYGAYQTAGHAAWRFGEIPYCKALIHELPRLIVALPYWAGDFLVSIANAQGTKDEPTIRVFNDLLFELDPTTKQGIIGFIRREEAPGGWLCNRVGVLGNNT
ncbi:conserved hypothetical protein [uncultured Stenotrophomonas sp.]|uniref:Immunity protein 30 domain-containing protein n=1 Tax=uncultured Stenotrophomonas sp. TaxID=165438 RepID=A0A1Y5Q5Y2_9GAMM|nr:conserved hypothetical protein [uncultured Stenotrophomonas sp.]